MTSYPTNVTDKQWQMIIPYIELVDRKRKYPLREIFNAMFYVVKTGCQWRMLPKDFAPWNLVYYYFRKWKNNGTFEEILSVLVGEVRKTAGRDECPSLGIIDSRSVKTSHHVDADRGIDGNKKIKGRKEHIVTDTLGLPLAIVIHAANVFDGVGAKKVLENLAYKYPRLKKILADGGYRGDDLAQSAKKYGWELSVVLRPDESSKKFHVLPKRWIVERTFSWIENCRRLALDFEFLSESALAMLQTSFIMLLLNKLFK